MLFFFISVEAQEGFSVFGYNVVNKSVIAVVSDLRRAEQRANEQGWLDDNDIQAVMEETP